MAIKWDEDAVRALQSFTNEGMSAAEIARELGCSEGAVYAKRSRLGIIAVKSVVQPEKETAPTISEERLYDIVDEVLMPHVKKLTDTISGLKLEVSTLTRRLKDYEARLDKLDCPINDWEQQESNAIKFGR